MSILDIGCGTGSHALILSDRKYRVVGVDLSKVMVREAKHRATAENATAEFFSQDMRKMRLNKEFDCSIMFETFLHLLTQSDLNNALTSLNRHLAKGGLFIFDFWNITGASKLAQDFGEAHRIKYYTPSEIKQCLNTNGFELLAVYNWNAKDKAQLEVPKKRTFQILAVSSKM